MKCLLPVLINQYNNQIFATGGERLTQVGLAEKTGIAASTISRLFNGSAQRYDAQTVERLCAFFNCQVGDLLALVDVGEVAKS
ncbi:MAG: helix-turn-helix domain-containing protein [Phormidesmis sp.]